MGLFQSQPEFANVLAEKHVRAGDTVTLQCEVNTEELSVTWEKDGQKLHCVHSKRIIKQNGKTLTLEIRNAEEKDDGLYTITLENTKGSVTCSARLTVGLPDWRKVEWNLGQMTNALGAFITRSNEVRELNFLLCGPIGAGKSSIINTINTIFKERIYITYQACSITSTFQKCKVGNAQDGFLPFVLYDSMGLGAGDSHGVHPDDCNTAVKGHMKDGYRFNPNTPIDENSPYYRANPSLSDRMHCLVHVIPADKISLMDSVIIQKINTISNAATTVGLPQVILMTRVDRVCPLTKNDLRYVYNSKKIKDKMEECSTALSVPMNCIFPVKNYHEETEINEDINCLMLHALTKIVQWADDYVVKYSSI